MRDDIKHTCTLLDFFAIPRLKRLVTIAVIVYIVLELSKLSYLHNTILNAIHTAPSLIS